MAAAKNEIAKPGKDFRAMLMKPAAQQALSRALPKHMKPEKIVSTALTAISLNPKLLDCDPNTVMRCVVLASQLGLEPGGALGSAYLVPFYNGRLKKYDCQMIVGYRGLIDLMRRSGAVLGVEARCVYDCDEFDIQYGTDTAVTHHPNINRPDSAEFIGAYCVIHIRDGQPLVEWMSREEIERIRKQAKADRGPWVDHYDEMARKTVVRRASKYAPMSTELATAVEADERADRGESQAAGALLELTIEDEPDVPQEDAIAAQLEEAGA